MPTAQGSLQAYFVRTTPRACRQGTGGQKFTTRIVNLPAKLAIAKRVAALETPRSFQKRRPQCIQKLPTLYRMRDPKLWTICAIVWVKNTLLGDPTTASEIQIFHAKGVLLNKLSARFHHIAH